MEAPRRCWSLCTSDLCTAGQAERQEVGIIRCVHLSVCVYVRVPLLSHHVYLHFLLSLCVSKYFTHSLWASMYVLWRWIPCHFQAGSWIGSGWAAASHHAEVQSYGTGHQNCWTPSCSRCQRKRHAACSSQGLKVRGRRLGQWSGGTEKQERAISDLLFVNWKIDTVWSHAIFKVYRYG